jgi:DNA uptake protein ComE-like DNA-binding protein
MIRFFKAAILTVALTFAATAYAQTPQPATPAPKTAPPTAAPAVKPAAPSHALLDINTASKEALDALPGVGPVRSAAIIGGRPYKGKDELVQKKILPQAVYDKIKDKIIAKQH